MLYYLIYTSVASSPPGEDDLRAILAQSRERNKRMGITGMLIYFNSKFMQLLEGKKEDVLLLFEYIRNDSRHKDVKVIKESSIAKRQYPDWSMNYKSLSPEEMRNVEGYVGLRRLEANGFEPVFSILKLLTLTE